MVVKAEKISSCYIGPQISPEHFIQEHFFIYLVTGTMHGFDGHKNYILTSGECCLVRKNRLARYNKQKEGDLFEKIIIVFDEPFLRDFLTRHPLPESIAPADEVFFRINGSELITSFIQSLSPYYGNAGKIDETFSRVKREELLLILLTTNPELKNILFDFGTPEKLNLEEFMNRNFKFNVSLERFAFLTGRSLSVFKKDFARIFNDTPGRWLVQKRLQEAYFLIDKEGKRSAEIYLDLGFEDLSHFSFAFKKKFGMAPNELIKGNGSKP